MRAGPRNLCDRAEKRCAPSAETYKSAHDRDPRAKSGTAELARADECGMHERKARVLSNDKTQCACCFQHALETRWQDAPGWVGCAHVVCCGTFYPDVKQHRAGGYF